MIPQITDKLQPDMQEYRQPDRTYKLTDMQIIGKIEKIEAVKQAIYHILQTERYSNPIYPDNYGVELVQFIGGSIEDIEANIETVLRESLTQDDRITDIQVTGIERQEVDTCKITFIVYTIYGQLEEYLSVVQ